MGDRRRRNCITCGVNESKVGPISWSGNCRSCGQINLVENIIGIATKQGYAHRRRLRGYERMIEKERQRIEAAQTRRELT